MSAPFAGAQRIVLHGTPWNEAQHLVLDFGASPQPLNFLQRLLQPDGLRWPGIGSAGKETELQVSLGFSRQGLERVCLPPHVLACFALKAPAFWEGAVLRAGRHLGLSGPSAPAGWLDAFRDTTRLDAVLSVHAMATEGLERALDAVRHLAGEAAIRVQELPRARRLARPADVAQPSAAAGKSPQWVHFGFRDGVARIGIEGWDSKAKLAQLKKESCHRAGEFLLGHPQDSEANPWIAGPVLGVWPEALRRFFRNGSFGVLHQIHQDAAAFQEFVQACAKETGLDVSTVKAKLCGRYPDGRSPAARPGADPEADFDYSDDREGHACPFGSHARRMNPRGGELAHAGRSRPLLRRGMPYGPSWTDGAERPQDKVQRGLMGQFFCASIEDQFEHLLGQWADRVPLGSDDGGGARDPLIGAHASGDGPFEIPQAGGRPLMLRHLRPFARTRGCAYLFYPGLQALQGMADSSLWGAVDQAKK